MPNLKNSQRITYKATYVQKSPTTTKSDSAKDPGSSLMRAVEKAAFIQALRITTEELTAIKRHAFDAAAINLGGKAGMAGALGAIESLINDSTATSTLKNASLFAKIDSTILVRIAELLVTQRESVGESIKGAVAGIITAYRESSTQPLKPSSPLPGPTPSNLPKGTQVVSGTNLRGAAITTVTFPPTAIEGRNREGAKVGSKSFKVSISVDESKPTVGSVSSYVSAASLETYQPSGKDAVAWAERNQPDLFASLHNLVRPYLSVSAGESETVGKAKSIVDFMAAGFSDRFNITGTKGAAAGFQARMDIEPVGNLHLERIEMYPAGIERGELVHSVPLAPAETVNISHKEWSVTEREFEDIVQDFFEGYSEQGVAEKNDIAMSNESQSRHSTALSLGASLSASYSSVTLSTNFGYNATSDDQQSKKDSRNHSMAITKKASARTKKDHKVTFKVSSVAGSEDQAVRVITNSSDTDAMRIDYFQLARKWKVDLLRYGLRMTYDIVIPNPGSGIVTKVAQVKELDAMIDLPFSFALPLSAITYNSLATDPHNISNYDVLAAQYDASVTAPPDARKFVNRHNETQEVKDYDHVHFDSLDFDIDDGYYIYASQVEFSWQNDLSGPPDAAGNPTGDPKSYFTMLNGEYVEVALANMIGESGRLSLDFVYQYIYNYAIDITITCRPKVQALLDWRLQVWNQIRQAAEDQYNKSVQNLKDQRAKLLEEISGYDALTLRRMEQEEIMKGVLRWLFGPSFYLVPFSIAGLFGPDTNDPEVKDVIDPNRLSDAEWQDVMEHGEFIKYIHNAIEWENVLYFTYPYFWDDNSLWDFKKFLYHPDPTHRMFLRSGAARVVLTIRPGFEPSFTQLVESGAFTSLPSPHPYVTIAQEIQDFANTNYPGFPPANPEQNARPLLYLEQRRVWKEMQFIIQLLNAFKSDGANNGQYPASIATNAVPAAALQPYLNGPIVVMTPSGAKNFNGINDYNNQANAQQLLLDPNTPQEALLPTYANVPVNDFWKTPYFYKSPGDTGDYDLISYGADGKPGGTDKDADISANAEASLVATWFEYTPTNALDIGITMNKANVTPADVKPDIA